MLVKVYVSLPNFALLRNGERTHASLVPDPTFYRAEVLVPDSWIVSHDGTKVELRKVIPFLGGGPL